MKKSVYWWLFFVSFLAVASFNIGFAEGACSGAPHDCSYEAINEESCRTAGCTPKMSCAGTPYPCSYYNELYDEAGCRAAGCGWESYEGQGFCSGTPRACSYYHANPYACQAVDCEWGYYSPYSYCTGTHNSCESYADAVSCANHGCAWADFGEGANEEAPGEDDSGSVSLEELGVKIAEWINGNADLNELIGAIKSWISG